MAVPLGLRAMLSGGAIACVAAGILRVESSGAVPAGEFPPAVPVYLAAPWVLAAGMALLLYGVVRLVRRRCAGHRPGQCTDGFSLSPRSAIRCTFMMTSAVTASALLLGLLESWCFTSRFVPGLVTTEQLTAYQSGLGEMALLIGLQAAALGIGGLLAVAGAIRLAPRRSRAICAVALGGGAALLLTGLIHLTLNAELTELGLWPAVIGAATCLGGLAACSVARQLGAQTPRPGRDLADTLTSLPARLVGGTPKLVVVAAILLGALAPALYPEVEDFRMQLFPSLALAAILVFALALGAIGRASGRPRTTLAISGGCLVLAALSLPLAANAPDAALVAHEYSRFGSLVTDLPATRWLSHLEEIGIDDPGTPPWPHHTSGTEHLPELPDGVPAPGGRPPIIIVLWDAARPDRCSAFGYARPTTPNLRRLADRSLSFERAYSTATATTAAVKGLLSGRYSTRYMLASGHPPFLTRDLADAGYDHFIVTVTGNDHNGVSGEAFRRGWEPGEHLTFEDLEFENLDGAELDATKTTALLDALRRRKSVAGSLDRTFAYLHLLGTHIPWTGDGSPVEFGDTTADRYDEEMAKADALLGRLLDGLTKLGVKERAVLVVTADHGSGLGEHGKTAGYLMYEEQIRVPLILHIPGVPHRRIQDPVGSIDVAPTLMNLLRPGQPHRYHGRSLLPLAVGDVLPPRPFVSFCAFRDSYALFDEMFRWKLHHHRGRGYEALFDLEADPRERKNLITERADIAAKLRRMLDGFLWEGRDSYGNPYHYRAWAGPGG